MTCSTLFITIHSTVSTTFLKLSEMLVWNRLYVTVHFQNCNFTCTVPLSIHPSTGVISTSAVLDREAMDRIVFTVVIKDNGQPSKIASGKVTVYLLDADDNPPVLSQALYEGVVLEDNAQPLPEQVVQMVGIRRIAPIDQHDSAWLLQ